MSFPFHYSHYVGKYYCLYIDFRQKEQRQEKARTTKDLSMPILQYQRPLSLQL